MKINKKLEQLNEDIYNMEFEDKVHPEVPASFAAAVEDSKKTKEEIDKRIKEHTKEFADDLDNTEESKNKHKVLSTPETKKMHLSESLDDPTAEALFEYIAVQKTLDSSDPWHNLAVELLNFIDDYDLKRFVKLYYYPKKIFGRNESLLTGNSLNISPSINVSPALNMDDLNIGLAPISEDADLDEIEDYDMWTYVYNLITRDKPGHLRPLNILKDAEGKTYTHKHFPYADDISGIEDRDAHVSTDVDGHIVIAVPDKSELDEITKIMDIIKIPYKFEADGTWTRMLIDAPVDIRPEDYFKSVGLNAEDFLSKYYLNAIKKKKYQKNDDDILDEAAYIKTGIYNFKPSGIDAREAYNKIREEGKLSEFQDLLYKLYEDEDGIDSDEVDQLLTFEKDWLFNMLNIK